MAHLTYPFTITPNTLASASQVMGNFDAIKSILNGGIDGTNLADGAVTAGKLASKAVDTSALADGAVTDGKLADGAVTNAKVAAAAAIALSKLAAVVASKVLVSSAEGVITASDVDVSDLEELPTLISQVADLAAALDGKLGKTEKAADSDKLDNLDSAAFLRSNTSDSYTSGTLTFSGGTTLNLASAKLIIPTG